MSTIDDKLQEILDNADFDSALLNVNIERDIQNNLLDYQVLHVQNLVGSIEKNKIAIDTSDTGCGKTYCALAVCKQLNLNPIIICPKSIISNWKKMGVVNFDGSELKTNLNAALILPDGKENSPIFLVFENYERILKWNRSLRFGISVCTLARMIKI